MSIWNEQTDALLRKLHADGLPFSLIGDEIAKTFDVHCTRNSAIGRAARLGLQKREERKPAQTSLFGFGRVKPRSPRPPRASRQAPILEAEISELPPDHSDCAVDIMHLDSARTLCRWPLGDPSATMLYCGANSVEGSSYCPRHHAIAYPKPVKISEEERERRRQLGRRMARINNGQRAA